MRIVCLFDEREDLLDLRTEYGTQLWLSPNADAIEVESYYSHSQ
jgi:hypothetical protein